jgi:uncharacterized protein YfcZ (UPF0381/DUF406 family)
MKVCKKTHEEIIFDDSESVLCPMCLAFASMKTQEDIIQDLHEQALKREDYICKIEEQNTKMEEAVRTNSLFTYETITWDTLPPVKPTKKRSHKKKPLTNL